RSAQDEAVAREECEATDVRVDVVAVRRRAIELTTKEAIRVANSFAVNIICKDRDSFVELISHANHKLAHVDEAARLPLEDVAELRIRSNGRSARQRRVDVAQNQSVPRAIKEGHA